MIHFIINNTSINIFTEGRYSVENLKEGTCKISVDMSKEEMNLLTEQIRRELWQVEEDLH